MKHQIKKFFSIIALMVMIMTVFLSAFAMEDDHESPKVEEPKIKEVVSAQLREFMSLEAETGKFKVVPEYPEFAWQEGIVNAITHREYAIYGDYIRVKMFDDRLEIQSPGCLPNIVTVSNIKETRYSRNPRIARVLTEFGWVRELNEGVPRIFADMNAFRLAAPEYSEPDRQMVKLVLYNDINIRTLRYQENAQNVIGGTDWEKLDDLSKAILIFIDTFIFK